MKQKKRSVTNTETQHRHLRYSETISKSSRILLWEIDRIFLTPGQLIGGKRDLQMSYSSKYNNCIRIQSCSMMLFLWTLNSLYDGWKMESVVFFLSWTTKASDINIQFLCRIVDGRTVQQRWMSKAILPSGPLLKPPVLRTIAKGRPSGASAVSFLSKRMPIPRKTMIAL